MRREELIVDTLENPFTDVPDLNLTQEDIDIFVGTRVWKEIVSMYNKKIVRYRMDLHDLGMPHQVQQALLAKLAMSEQLVALPKWLRSQEPRDEDDSKAEDALDRIMKEQHHA